MLGSPVDAATSTRAALPASKISAAFPAAHLFLQAGGRPEGSEEWPGSEGREEGIYLFDDVVDAEAFQEAAGSRGGEAELCECPLHDIYAAYRLIVAERER